MKSPFNSQKETTIIDIIPDDLTNCFALERKLYKNIPVHSYVYANDEMNRVRMLVIKKNNKFTMFYCVNKKENACLPIICEDSEGNEFYKEEYSIKKEIDIKLEYFMENLGYNDIIRTHEFALKPTDNNDDDILNILKKHFFLK